MKRFSTTLALLSLLLGPAAPAWADNLQLGLHEMAQQAATELKGQKSIKIGKFSAKGDAPSAFGPEIQRVLSMEFEALKMTPDPKATIEINGDYRALDKDPERPQQKETFVRINAQLVDRCTGAPLKNAPIDSQLIYGNGLLARVFAPTANIPLDADRQKENEVLRRSIDKPAFYLAGRRVATKESSPFSVEVLVVDDKDAPDPATGVAVGKTPEGQAFVLIRRNQFYRLKIHNNAPFDVAVKIGIDGIDQFVFSDKEFRNDENKPKYNYRIVPKGKSVVVAGWFRTLKHFDYFVVTEYAKSASAELKRAPDEAGQIGLQFYACWASDADKPTDEPSNRSATDSTGRIPGGRDDLKEVAVTVGELRETIGIRYGSGRP